MNIHADFLNILTRVRDILADDTGGCALEPLPCRVATYPAGEVPFDACGDGDCGNGREGQLWVALQPTPAPATQGAAGAGCARFTLTGQIGITRCAAPPTSDLQPPEPGAVEANAVQQVLDADRIADALLCCPELDREDRARIAVGGWQPIDTQGGCYGGFWTVTAVYDVCCG